MKALSGVDWDELILGPIRALLLFVFAVVAAAIAAVAYPFLKFIAWVYER